MAFSAGLLLAGVGGCSTAGRQSSAPSNPETRQVRASQEQSEKSLDEAKKAQQRASEQAKRAADAEQQVQKAQQQLADAQAKARTEQEKARQFQAEASQATRSAMEGAQQSQQQASRALSKQSQHLAAGEQLVSGQILQASGDQLVVSPDGGGAPMTFSVTGQTQVRISGQRASAEDIQQGEDARVSYVVSGTRPEAVMVQVMRTPVGAGQQPSSTGTDRSQEPGTASPGSSGATPDSGR
jgi:hypothetical protein